jgi:hypothetical protein
MMKSYVGIVSKNGIELFYPEDPATVRFLWRRVQRQKGRVACVWGVLPADAAELIQIEISLGWTREAMTICSSMPVNMDSSFPIRTKFRLWFNTADGRVSCCLHCERRMQFKSRQENVTIP